MGKKQRQGTGKRRAILEALGRLGWHARGKDVVALLANFGIEVNEGLVGKVRVESQKRPEDVKRQEEKVKRADKRRMRPMNQKRPQQRTYRR